MNLLKPQTIEETLVPCLAGGSKHTEELLQELRTRRGTTTKQGFYAALRKLKKEEVVVIYKSTVALNSSWVAGMQNMVDEMNTAYAGGESNSLLTLSDKESVSYVFLNTRHLDVFWGHSQNLLIKNTPSSEPEYAYDPHYWFYLARRETESKLLEQLTKNGRQFLMTVGGDTPLDNAIRKDFQTDYLQYHYNPFFERNNYYVTVIGDYITEVLLDPGITAKVDAVYKASGVNAATEQLQQLLNLKSRNKIRISRNRKKAAALKISLGKNFFIKQAAAK